MLHRLSVKESRGREGGGGEINCDTGSGFLNQKTNDPVNAHLISGPRKSTTHTKPRKNKVKK